MHSLSLRNWRANNERVFRSIHVCTAFSPTPYAKVLKIHTGVTLHMRPKSHAGERAVPKCRRTGGQPASARQQ